MPGFVGIAPAGLVKLRELEPVIAALEPWATWHCSQPMRVVPCLNMKTESPPEVSARDDALPAASGRPLYRVWHVMHHAVMRPVVLVSA